MNCEYSGDALEIAEFSLDADHQIEIFHNLKKPSMESMETETHSTIHTHTHIIYIRKERNGDLSERTQLNYAFSDINYGDCLNA